MNGFPWKRYLVPRYLEKPTLVLWHQKRAPMKPELNLHGELVLQVHLLRCVCVSSVPLFYQPPAACRAWERGRRELPGADSDVSFSTPFHPISITYVLQCDPHCQTSLTHHWFLQGKAIEMKRLRGGWRGWGCGADSVTRSLLGESRFWEDPDMNLDCTVDSWTPWGSSH